ncbi:MAG TPA: BLUF domain-containing protein [Pseudolabrys sp.]|jgi:hypothetical protein|nr:BLUF domain-containing protein [Pseudolabrys sp.]
MLTRLIYHSENHLGAADGKMIAPLNAIMDASIRNNERDGITGALLADTLWFVQILEGERETVSVALARIMRDPRHDAVTVMDCRPIGKRQFGNWWMGLASLKRADPALLQRLGIVKFDPRRMSAEQVLTVATALADIGLSRRLTPPAA